MKVSLMNRSTLALSAALISIALGSQSCSDGSDASLQKRLDQTAATDAQRSPSDSDQRLGNRLGDARSRCDGANQVWGLTSSSRTSWYAVKKKVLPVEGVVGNEGYIETAVDASYSDFNFELLFNIDKLNSQNPLRDTRIRSLFFADIATATFTLEEIRKSSSSNDLPVVGDTHKVEFRGTIAMAGTTLKATIPAYVTRTIDSLHIVNSDKPTSLDVSKDNILVSGVQSLLEVANLASDDMEDDVTIKFDYTFKQACQN